MKTKKHFLSIIVLLMVFVLGLASCKDKGPTEDTLLTIDSRLTATIEVGQTYTLQYSCNGTVTVTVSGGTYVESSHKFSADTAGEYTITVKGIEEGKKEAIATVTITVVAGPNRTALNSAIASTTSLIASDYTTTSWAAFQTAKKAALDLQEGFGKTQAEIDQAVTTLQEKVAALVKQAIDKVVANEDGFTYNTTRYLASDYDNYATILDEIEELNADTTIVLKSVYKTKMDEIVGKLVGKIPLVVNNAPQGQMMVSTLKTYNLTAETTEADAVFEWKLNGKKVGDGATYAFTPTAFGEPFKIEVTATKGTQTTTRVYEGSFIKAVAEVNSEFASKISVEDDVIKVNDSLGWGAQEGKKVLFPNLSISGNFSVTFTVNFKTSAIPGVMALFMLDENGNSLTNWVAVCQHINCLETAVGGEGNQKPQYDMPSGTSDLNKDIIIRYSREIINNKAYYKSELLDESGNPLPLKNIRNSGMEFYSNDGYIGGDTSKERLYSEYVGAITLGVQAENAKFEVSNFSINNGAQVNSKYALKELVESTNDIIKTDYKAEFVTAYETALAGAKETLRKAGALKAEIDEKYAALAEALADLKPENYVEVTKAQVNLESGEIYYSVIDLTLSKDEIYNFDEIANAIIALNGNNDFASNSAYTKALDILLESADFNISLSTVDCILKSETKVIAPANPEYTITLNSKTKDATYSWYVNNTIVDNEDGKTFIFKPEHSGIYSVKVVAQKNGTGNETKKFEYEIKNVEILLTSMETRPQFVENRNANIDSEGTFKIDAGADWGAWEGRKLLINDTIFFGSFTVTADVKIVKRSGVDVVTFHLMNADTLSPNDTKDNAIVGLGAIVLRDGKLETQVQGDRAQMDIPNPDKYREEGSTITIKLTVLRSKEEGKNHKVQLIMSLLDNETGEWINFVRDDVYSGNEFQNGLYVGVNIEHVGIEMSNIRYDLLAETQTYYAGDVKSKLLLHNAVKEYENVNYLEYENGVAFLNAYRAAVRAMEMNDIETKYNEIAETLIDAYKDLVQRTTPQFTVEGLDNGDVVLRGYNTLTAQFADDVTATDVKWSYTFNDSQTATEVVGANLTMVVGTYKNVKVSFTAGGKNYVYAYQDFKVEALGLKSNASEVVVSSDGASATVTTGAGWNHKEQLVFDGVNYAKEFELTFDVSYLSSAGGDYQVMCINVFGEDIRAVLGYQRQGTENRVQLGFDNKNLWNDLTSAEDLEYMRGTSKIGLTQKVDANGKYTVTMTVYKADGSVLTTMSDTYIRWYTSTSAIRFTFENVNLKLSNFKLTYSTR